MSEGQSSGKGYGEGVQDQGAPLTQEEKKLVSRLFSEPLEFPMVFRNWLKLFIESSGIILPKSSIATGVGGGGGSFAGLPSGMIIPMGGSTIPSGSLPCNGAAVSREQYDALFKVIGTTWGAGDGTTTFNVPDLRDRALYGAGSKVGLGTTDGGALGVRGPRHKHTLSIPNSSSGYNSFSGGTDGAGSHSHGVTVPGGTVAFNAGQTAIVMQVAGPGTGGSTDGGGGHSHGVSVGGTVNVSGNVSGDTSGGGQADTPAFAGVQYVITT